MRARADLIVEPLPVSEVISEAYADAAEDDAFKALDAGAEQLVDAVKHYQTGEEADGDK